MPYSFAAVSLWSEDIAASIQFYCDIIGLRLLYQHKGRPYFDLGGAYLVILEGRPQKPSAENADRFPAIAFQVNDLDAEQERLRGLGISMPWGLEEDAGSRWILFYDPGGNLVQLIQYRV